MPVSEPRRRDLFSWFEEAMGPDRAATMMDLLPPPGSEGVATKEAVSLVRQDLAALEERTGLRFDALEERTGLRFAALEERIAVRFDAMDERTELRFQTMDERMGSVETRLESRLQQEIVGATRTFVTWLIATNAAVVAAIGIAAGLVIGLS